MLVRPLSLVSVGLLASLLGACGFRTGLKIEGPEQTLDDGGTQNDLGASDMGNVSQSDMGADSGGCTPDPVACELTADTCAYYEPRCEIANGTTTTYCELLLFPANTPCTAYNGQPGTCNGTDTTCQLVEPPIDMGVRDMGVRDMNVRDMNIRDMSIRDMNVRDMNIRDMNIRDMNVSQPCNPDLEGELCSMEQCRLFEWTCDTAGQMVCTFLGNISENTACGPDAVCDGAGACVTREDGGLPPRRDGGGFGPTMCMSNSDCSPIGPVQQVCWLEFGYCAPRCDALGGFSTCTLLGSGYVCDPMTGTCVR